MLMTLKMWPWRSRTFNRSWDINKNPAHLQSPIPSFSRQIPNLLQSGTFCHTASAGGRLEILCAPWSLEIFFSTLLLQQLQWRDLRFFYNYNTQTAGKSEGIKPEELADVLNKTYNQDSDLSVFPFDAWSSLIQWFSDFPERCVYLKGRSKINWNST